VSKLICTGSIGTEQQIAAEWQRGPHSRTQTTTHTHRPSAAQKQRRVVLLLCCMAWRRQRRQGGLRRERAKMAVSCFLIHATPAAEASRNPEAYYLLLLPAMLITSSGRSLEECTSCRASKAPVESRSPWLLPRPTEYGGNPGYTLLPSSPNTQLQAQGSNPPLPACACPDWAVDESPAPPPALSLARPLGLLSMHPCGGRSWCWCWCWCGC
jgi:hypothetical protein